MPTDRLAEETRRAREELARLRAQRAAPEAAWWRGSNSGNERAGSHTDNRPPDARAGRRQSRERFEPPVDDATAGSSSSPKPTVGAGELLSPPPAPPLPAPEPAEGARAGRPLATSKPTDELLSPPRPRRRPCPSRQRRRPRSPRSSRRSTTSWARCSRWRWRRSGPTPRRWRWTRTSGWPCPRSRTGAPRVDGRGLPRPAAPAERRRPAHLAPAGRPYRGGARLEFEIFAGRCRKGGAAIKELHVRLAEKESETARLGRQLGAVLHDQRNGTDELGRQLTAARGVEDGVCSVGRAEEFTASRPRGSSC